MAPKMKPAYEYVCNDVNSTNDDNCWGHIQWAIAAGMAEHPDWYPNGTTLSVADMQCALYLKIGGEEGNSHNCTLPPCSDVSASMSGGGDTEVKYCSEPRMVAVEETPGPSIEWWGWALIVAAVLLVCGLAAFALGLFGTKKPKKKRAIKALEPEPAPVTTTVTAVPTYEVAPPIYTYAAQPAFQATQSIAVAAPSVVTAAPMYSTSTVAAPMYTASMAAPVYETVAAPMYTTAPAPMYEVAAPMYATAPAI